MKRLGIDGSKGVNPTIWRSSFRRCRWIEHWRNEGIERITKVYGRLSNRTSNRADSEILEMSIAANLDPLLIQVKWIRSLPMLRRLHGPHLIF
jgi:hypothetical protein